MTDQATPQTQAGGSECPECGGTDGHHLMACAELKDQGLVPIEGLRSAGEPCPGCGRPDGFHEKGCDGTASPVGGAPETEREKTARVRRMVDDAAVTAGMRPPASDGMSTQELINSGGEEGVGPYVGVAAAARVPLTPEELVLGMETSVLHEWIAKLCHEVNRVSCAARGDFSHVAWEDLDPALRDSVVAGVAYHAERPGTTPAESHAEWMAYKLDEGWTFGNRKDYVERTHPNLVPYEQLHRDERAKDAVFTTICNVFFGRPV